MPKIAPYGTWESPISVDHLSGGSIHFEGIYANPSTGRTYVLESRPAEGGRFAIVEFDEFAGRDVLPTAYNAVGTIHEYGGGSMAMHPDGRLLFTSHPDNGVFLLDASSGAVETVVAPDRSVRFGDFNVQPTTAEWILAVREGHSKGSNGEAVVTNSIVAIQASTGSVTCIAEGADFYQHPHFDLDGRRVCWTQWDHPDMPWSGTLLYVALWEDGRPLKCHLVSGEAGVESICQPRWGMDGSLFFVSDKSGYWQMYRFDGHATNRILLKGLETAEFGSREPSLGNCTYFQLNETTLVASATENATSNLISINLNDNSWVDLSLPLVDIQKNAMARLSPRAFVVIGSTRTEPQALYRVTLHGNDASMKLLRPTVQLDIEHTLLSQARHISFPRKYSDSTDLAYAWFVAPKNDGYTAPSGTKPPLLVWMHGGPTYHVPPGLSLATQYWTSRGYAYVLVNHVGSTGYGRKYCKLLDGNWGAADVADAASCVAFLVDQGLADPNKVGIVGESAGGYAVMQAMYMYPDLWAAGISLYGISSLAEFAETTHKFESHYIDSLVLGGGKKSPEEINAIYRARSAVYHAAKIKAPLLLLQGDVDTIVPPWQTTRMEQVMRGLGKEVQGVIFEGEGHGFHMEKTIRTSTEVQARFWMEKML